MKNNMKTTKKSHTIIFGTLFLIILVFVFYKLAESVRLNPENIIVHTNVVYYDGKFSDTNKIEDTKTALYVLNQSDEVIYATVYEYGKDGKEMRTAIQIMGGQNQFIKTDGPGVIYLQNDENTSSSTIKFSRLATLKKYLLPDNYTFK